MSGELLELLTAYVDGELGPVEVARVHQLVQQSPEVADLLRRLQGDAAGIRNLPRVSLPPMFGSRLKARIVSQGQAVRPARKLGLLRRLQVAVAAALMLGIATGTYFVLKDLSARSGGNEPVASSPLQVTQLSPRSDLVAGDPPAHVPAGSGTDTSGSAHASVAPSTDLNQLLAAARVVAESIGGTGELVFSTVTELARAHAQATMNAENSVATESPFSDVSVLTSPIHGPTGAFKTIDLRLPLVAEMKSLDSSKLLSKLRQDSLHHLDLSCAESWKGFERLQAACKAAGVRLLVDQEVTQRIARKQPAMYMIYLENTNPEQVGKLLAAIQSEDQRAEARRKGDGQFESFLLQPLDEPGRKRLAESLGVPPATLSSAPPSTVKNLPPGIDPTRPLSEDTVKALEKLAAGQGSKVSAAKEPTAIAMVYYPNRARVPVPLSKDVKQHLDSRKGWSADAIHVVIVLRPSRG